MLQQNVPHDLVIATGLQYSVREFVSRAASVLGMKIEWEGEGINERAVDTNGRLIVTVDSRYFRPSEVETLLGDPSKARAILGWEPKISFNQLVEEMALSDLQNLKDGKR